MFNGSLNLLQMGGIEPIVHRMLSLRALTLAWICKDDISLTMAFVDKCSHTLELLGITCDSSCSTSAESASARK